MALKLNINRTFKQLVTLRFLDEDGKVKTGTFTAIFKALVLKKDETQTIEGLLDSVLVDIQDFDFTDENGNILEGQDLIDAVKRDMDVVEALVEAYNESIEKKRVKKPTSVKR